jgi:hypothetical protein
MFATKKFYLSVFTAAVLMIFEFCKHSPEFCSALLRRRLIKVETNGNKSDTLRNKNEKKTENLAAQNNYYNRAMVENRTESQRTSFFKRFFIGCNSRINPFKRAVFPFLSLSNGNNA